MCVCLALCMLCPHIYLVPGVGQCMQAQPHVWVYSNTWVCSVLCVRMSLYMCLACVHVRVCENVCP